MGPASGTAFMFTAVPSVYFLRPCYEGPGRNSIILAATERAEAQRVADTLIGRFPDMLTDRVYRLAHRALVPGLLGMEFGQFLSFVHGVIAVTTAHSVTLQPVNCRPVGRQVLQTLPVNDPSPLAVDRGRRRAPGSCLVPK